MNPAHRLLLTSLSAMTKSFLTSLTRGSPAPTTKSAQQKASVRNQGYCQGSLRLLTFFYMLGQSELGSSSPVALSSCRLSIDSQPLVCFRQFSWL